MNLEVLNLAHNKIASIQNLQMIAAPNYKIKSIDLRDNCLHDLRELIVLNSFKNNLKDIL